MDDSVVPPEWLFELPARARRRRWRRWSTPCGTGRTRRTRPGRKQSESAETLRNVSVCLEPAQSREQDELCRRADLAILHACDLGASGAAGGAGVALFVLTSLRSLNGPRMPG